MIAGGAVDACGYVAPAMELIYERGTPDFHAQWVDVENRLALTRPTPGVGDWPSPYLRLAESGAAELDLAPAHLPAFTGYDGDLEPGVLHDNVPGRLRAMDDAAIGVQLVQPTPAIDDAALLPVNLAAGVFEAFNEYVVTYCEAAPGRLRAVIQVHGSEPHWAALQIRRFASKSVVVGVTIHMPVRIAPDEPNFDQLWRALADTGLVLVVRPGAVSRVWTARHLLSYLEHSGVLDHHEALRFLFVGQGREWPIQHSHETSVDPAVSRLLECGRAYVGIDGAVSADMIESTAAQVGAGCMLWESHFPFASCASGAAFSRVPETLRSQLLYENPRRCLSERITLPAAA